MDARDSIKFTPPEQAISVHVEKNSVTQEFGKTYYGGSNEYHTEDTTLLRIVDKNGETHKGVWNEDWSETAPGIETKSLNTVWKYGFGEKALYQAIRIRRSACPVWIQLRTAYETIDYDSPDIEGGSREEWRCYRAKQRTGGGNILRRLWGL